MDVSQEIAVFQQYIESRNLVRKDFIEIDFADFSKYNIEVADLLLDFPEETIKACQIAANNLIDSEERKKSVQVLFFNLPDSSMVPLSEISDQLDKFLSFEGYVMKPSDIFLKCTNAKFECPSCGNIINVLMVGREWKEPQRCGCGRKGKFRLLNKSMMPFQRFELQEAVDYVPDKPKRPVKKSVFLPESLTRKDLNAKLQAGQRVKVHGFLELEELRSKMKFSKSNEFKTNIIANNVLPIENSWNAIKLDAPTIAKIKDMARRAVLLDEFAQSLAPSFEGYDLIRKSLILSHVEGKRIYDANGNLEERGVIHVLMAGAPGSGKTFLMKKAVVLSPLWQWAQGAGLTKAGLVAAVVKDEFGSFTLEVGPLVMANNGTAGLDELDKMDKGDYGILNNAMNDEQTKITKAAIDQMLRTRTSILATANPLHKTFVDSEPIMRQLAPIPKDVLDRFDVVWAMREEIDQEKMEDKYMARHLHSEVVNQIWSNEQMRNYIAYARRLVPFMDVKVAKYFRDKFQKLSGRTKDTSEEERQSHRLRGNILRWAYAYCKFTSVGMENDKNEIPLREKDIDFAFGIVLYSFKMLGVTNEDGFVKYEDVEMIPSKKEVNKYYLVRDALKKLAKDNKNLVPFEMILEECKKEMPDIDGDAVDQELAKLKKIGEIFEPRTNSWGLL